MIKVAMIGAGSVVFSNNLTGDILTFPTREGEIVVVAPQGSTPSSVKIR